MQDLAKLSAPQIIQAVRNRDLTVIRALVRDGIQSKKYTLDEYKAILEDNNCPVDKSTLSRWSRGVK